MKSTFIAIRSTKLSIGLFLILCVQTASAFNIGTGIYDITGAAAESGMFGYAAGQEVNGIQQRLRSRAFVIHDEDSGKRIVYVSADLGALFQSVKLEVVKKLKQRYGSLYGAENVMITATHTHAGNGGQSHYPLYILASADKSLLGYNSQNFRAATEGIFQSIVRAHNNLAPGSIRYNHGHLNNATKNRSIPAYNANEDSSVFSNNVNTLMNQLVFTKANGNEVGLINWFAMHTTSISNQYSKLSGDNKGYAQYLFERYKGTDYRASETFVAAFSNSDVGDVVPVDGNANSVAGFQGSSNELLNAERAGQKQYAKAIDLYQSDSQVLEGRLDYRHRWADFSDYYVRDQYTGNGVKRLCSAARGFSFAAGGENGPANIPGIYEGMTKGSFNITDSINQVDQSFLGSLIRFAFDIVPLGQDDPCQEEKPVLLSTGNLNWVPETLPFQIFVIGNLAIVGAPSEVNTMSARRIRETVQSSLALAGVENVVIASLANTYSGYLATYEEFQAQHYEGASTEFGPYTLAAYQQEFGDLSEALLYGFELNDDVQPEDKSQQFRLERPGVVFDDKYWWQRFGQTLSNANRSYNRGQTVNVRFRGGHPKNNLKTQGSFLVVQKKVGSNWVDTLYDWDWDTEYQWTRDGIARSFVDIKWRISDDTAPGTYRIRHDGHWKNGWTGRVRSYTGYSRSFTVQ